MTRRTRTTQAWVLCACLSGTLLNAGTAQSRPRWIASKRFWVGLSIVSAGSLADGITTQNCLRRYACWERDPIFGRYPSRARTYGEGAAFDAAIGYAIWKTKPRVGMAALAGFTSLEVFNSVESTRW